MWCSHVGLLHQIFQTMMQLNIPHCFQESVLSNADMSIGTYLVSQMICPHPPLPHTHKRNFGMWWRLNWDGCNFRGSHIISGINVSENETNPVPFEWFDIEVELNQFWLVFNSVITWGGFFSLSLMYFSFLCRKEKLKLRNKPPRKRHACVESLHNF